MIRPAVAADLAPLADLAPPADLWHAAWHDAHAAHVPAELVELRTRDAFEQRLRGFGDRLRVAETPDGLAGLCVVQENRIDQIYVAAAARGTGAAALLLADGEARLRRSGATLAQLDCVIENHRAIRFYEKHFWRRQGVETGTVETAQGAFRLPLMILVKRLA